MKYSGLPGGKSGKIMVNRLDGGVNLAAVSSEIADNQLSACQNMWVEKGLLKTRPGLYADAESIIGRSGEGWDSTLGCQLTEVVVYRGGKKKRLLYTSEIEGDAHHLLKIYLLGEDDSVTGAGCIEHNRVSSESFSLPESVLFFAASPVNGGGVFALLKVSEQYTGENPYYHVFEINSSFTGWEINRDYYTPTLYINGRGTRYSEVDEYTRADATPKELETQNILYDRFYAYFNSDGISHAFRLPVTGLSNKFIQCFVYVSPTLVYQWNIPAGQTSATIPFGASEVTLEVDREKGVFSFKTGTVGFSVPAMGWYKMNNIKFAAYKAVPDGEARIISCKQSAVSDSRLFLSGGKKGNEIYTARLSNPLYFPVGATAVLGDATNPVTALHIQDERVAAFKDNETYLINLTKGKAFSNNSLLYDTDRLFYRLDTLNFSLIHDQIGCGLPRTLKRCGNRLVWLNTGGEVCVLDSAAAGKILILSDPAAELIKGFSPQRLSEAIGAQWEGHYLLMIDRKAIIMDYNVEGLRRSSHLKRGTGENADITWHIWDFADSFRIIAAAENVGGVRFICAGSRNDLLYKATPAGSRDTDMVILSGAPEVRFSPVKAEFSTKAFSLGDFGDKGNVEEITLSLKSDARVNLMLECDTGSVTESLTAVSDTEELKTIRLLPGLHGTGSLRLTASGDEGFSFGALKINYTV